MNLQEVREELSRRSFQAAREPDPEAARAQGREITEALGLVDTIAEQNKVVETLKRSNESLKKRLFAMRVRNDVLNQLLDKALTALKGPE